MSEPDLTDLNAEQQVVATVLAQPAYVGVLDHLDGAFTSHIHKTIADTIRKLHAQSGTHTVEQVMHMAPLEVGGGRRGDHIRNAILELITLGNPASLDFFVDRVAALHRARSVREIALRLTQQADEFASTDDPEALSRAIRGAGELLQRQNSAATGGEPAERLSTLLSERVEYDWLVPELLEVTDRLIITGFEGTGKSYLLAQFAACLAGGIHPFLFTPLSEPKRVLVIDAENSRKQVARRYRMMTGKVDLKCRDHGMAPTIWDDTLGFLIRPEGLPLNDPLVVRLVENMIVDMAPDIVIAGPLYRLHSSDTKDEQAAKELISIIDDLRIRYHFAFMCEAHVNHGTPGAGRQLRPTGSSVFLRWPEFGIGLRPTAEEENNAHPSVVHVTHWRGGREERIWPHRLQHVHAMAWGPNDEQYYDTHHRLGLI